MSKATLVIGGNGGIGGAILRKLSARRGRLLATTRSDVSDSTPVHWLHLDLEDPASIEAAAASARDALGDDATLDAIYICTGLLHNDQVRPERRLQDISADSFLAAMRVNALGPLLVAKAFAPLLPRREPSRLAAISARVGSISDNRLGGWYAYRCSKAALNMAWQTAAIELRRTHPGCALTVYQPGTVDTGLSAPFQSSVDDEDLLSAEEAAGYFLNVLDARGDAPGLKFLDWQGQEVPF